LGRLSASNVGKSRQQNGNNIAEVIVLSPGYFHYENFHPSTPVFEIDGDFVPLIVAAAMWDPTDSISDAHRFNRDGDRTPLGDSGSFPDGDIPADSNSR